MILALDPGTVTGWATPLDSGTWDLTPKKARKRPPTPAEPEQVRCGRLFENVLNAIDQTSTGSTLVVVEGAAAFMRGKAAVKVSHELRGAIKAACYWRGNATYEEIQPHDWKKALFGRGDVAPNEYLARARDVLGYQGTSEDEAAALWLLEWARRYRTDNAARRTA